MTVGTEGWIFNAVVVLAAAGGLYFFWMFCRKVVKWGFFTGYFLLGAAIALALNPQRDPWLPVAAGLSFAWAIMSIKNKIWRVVMPVALLGALSLVVPAVLDAREDAPKAPKRPSDRRL